jgi:hypothetical protein
MRNSHQRYTCHSADRCSNQTFDVTFTALKHEPVDKDFYLAHRTVVLVPLRLAKEGTKGCGEI